jgi:hypothetical protein
MQKLIDSIWYVGAISSIISIGIYFFMKIPEPQVHQPTALITKDGCTIYKWYDKGERMYYTKCEDGSSPTISR